MAKAPLPFGMGKFPISLDMDTGVLAALMIVGFMVFHLTDDLGAVLANRVKATIASTFNVSMGSNDGGASWGTAN